MVRSRPQRFYCMLSIVVWCGVPSHQPNHQTLLVKSDRLKGDWTHHWLFATACAPDGTWERLTEALRVGVLQVAYGGEMEAMMGSARLERSLGRVFPQAPVGRPSQRV